MSVIMKCGVVLMANFAKMGMVIIKWVQGTLAKISKMVGGMYTLKSLDLHEIHCIVCCRHYLMSHF